MTKRGRILRDTNAGPGMLTVEGIQYVFTLEGMWRSDVPPRTGMTVDVDFDNNSAPKAVYAVSETQVAKEQAQRAVPDALLAGETVRSGIKARFGIVPLGIEALQLIAFFVLPNLFVGNAFGRRAFTGWEAVGLNAATYTSIDHGLLSLLALVCLFAPLVVPFLKASWSRWVYTAPLGFVALATITLYAQIQNSVRASSQAMSGLLGNGAAQQMAHEVTGMFTPALGAYVVLLCSLYFAARAFRARA